MKPDTRVVPADGRVMTGGDIVRHRDMYQKLFLTMIDYMNMGLGPEDAVTRNPLKEYASEFGDPSTLHLRRSSEHVDRLRARLGQRPVARWPFVTGAAARPGRLETAGQLTGGGPIC